MHLKIIQLQLLIYKLCTFNLEEHYLKYNLVECIEMSRWLRNVDAQCCHLEHLAAVVEIDRLGRKCKGTIIILFQIKL